MSEKHMLICAGCYKKISEVPNATKTYSVVCPFCKLGQQITSKSNALKFNGATRKYPQEYLENQ